MFTGIIESLGTIKHLEQDQSNLHLTIESSVSKELKIDQSIAHNGVCLTVVKQEGDTHVVTAIKETLDKSNIGNLSVGDVVNLERCTKVGDRLDGHIVQGHVDCTGICTKIQDENGSYIFTISYDTDHVTVEKGSVCVNGTSLTVVNSKDQEFSLAIIPYTYENTSFKQLKVGDSVNLEFDIVGKYIQKLQLKQLI